MAKNVIKAANVLNMKVKDLVIVKQTDISIDTDESYETSKVICVCDKTVAMSIAMSICDCKNLACVARVVTLGQLRNLIPKRWIRDFYRGFEDDDDNAKIFGPEIIVVGYYDDDGELFALSVFQLIQVDQFDSLGVCYVDDNPLYVQPTSKIFGIDDDEEDEVEDDEDVVDDMDNNRVRSFVECNPVARHTVLPDFDFEEE